MMLITDRTERLDPGSRLLVGNSWLTVASSRDAGTRWLVHFDGIDDRTAAEGHANQKVMAEPLAERGEGLYVDELVGSKVVGIDGVEHGTCVAVIDNPAHDLLELDDGALVPVVFVVGAADGVVTIDPPEGLFDLD